jgi:hypothetical protein
MLSTHISADERKQTAKFFQEALLTEDRFKAQWKES